MLNNNTSGTNSTIDALIMTATGTEPARPSQIEPERPRSALGMDRYRRPRTAYYDSLTKMSDDELQKAAHRDFVLCHLGGDPDSRWKIDAVEWECARRGKSHLYDAGWESASQVDLGNRV